jgi:FkbM family methyltransferase
VRTEFFSYVLKIGKHIVPDWLFLPALRGPLRGYKWHVRCLGLEPWLGIYEQPEMAKLKELVRQGAVFYDVGAHEGTFSLYGSRLVGASGQVLAFEPVERNSGYLKRHIRKNGCSNVRVFEYAVVDKPGTVKFKLGSTYAQGSVSSDGTISVKAVSIDDLVYNQNWPVPDVLKIDVQGAEALVLDGMKKTLADHKIKMLISCHSTGIGKAGSTTQDCLEILSKLGYQAAAVDNKELAVSESLYAFK